MSAFVYEPNEVFDGPSIHMPPSCIICFTHVLCKHGLPFRSKQHLQCIARTHNTLQRGVDTTNKFQDVEFLGVVAFVIVPTNHHEDVCLSCKPTMECNCILYCNPLLAI